MPADKPFPAVSLQAPNRDDCDFVMASPIEVPREGPPRTPPFAVDWALAAWANLDGGTLLSPCDEEVSD